MHRREFVKGTAAAAALTMVPDAIARAAESTVRAPNGEQPKAFKLRYAFDAGQFSNHAPGGVIDELKFAHDQGFTAMEDNRMKGRPVAEQEAIAREMQRLGMTMGIFVNNGQTGFKPGGSLTTGKPEERDAFLAEVRSTIETAKRVNAKWVTSLVGNADAKLPRGYQTANVIENHPGFFIHNNDEMYALMKAVRSPSCKLLFDFYHSQISEGHMIYNFDKCFDEIG